jgi:hypothetical protein
MFVVVVFCLRLCLFVCSLLVWFGSGVGFGIF